MNALESQPALLEDEPSREISRLGFAWRVVKDRPSAAIGVGLVGFFVLVALFAPALEPYGLHQKVGDVYAPPSAVHPLGLDDGGVDMLSLIIQGGRISLVVGFAAAMVATFIGGGVGIVAGYFGGGADVGLMRVTDYFLVIPDVPLMIVVATLWGPSLSHVILVIGILLWTSTARIVRAQVKSVRERTYVKRARSVGAGNIRIIGRHVLPQIAPLLIANVVLTVAVAIFDETALAFLGLSDPSAVSWGSVIQHAFERTAISSGAWWAIVPPGICVALVIIGCYLVGQAIEDALNPRLKVAHLSVKTFRMRTLVGRGVDAT
jgi:peptide/nickel transport system permease protein